MGPLSDRSATTLDTGIRKTPNPGTIKVGLQWLHKLTLCNPIPIEEAPNYSQLNASWKVEPNRQLSNATLNGPRVQVCSNPSPALGPRYANCPAQGK